MTNKQADELLADLDDNSESRFPDARKLAKYADLFEQAKAELS